MLPAPETTTARDSLINQLSQLPAGELWQDLTPAWHQRFAVLTQGEGKLAHILVVPDMLGNASLYELQRRLRQKGFDPIRCLPTSAEIIALLHSRRLNNDLGSISSDDATRIERLAQELVEAAVTYQASDIHIETRDRHADVLFRINGERKLIRTLTFATARSLGVVLYSVHADAASKDITWDPQQVMDGAIEYQLLNGDPVQLRFSSAPIHPSGNFHIVIRVLQMRATALPLQALGYSQQQLTTLEDAISSQSGLVILCGPTNSGKSTTLQALVNLLHQQRGERIKIISVEDPVEYVLPGACQIGVARRRKQLLDEHTQSVYTTYLRGTLRQDPDVVLVGEIRDAQSAAVVKDLVLSGRKVLTTLHTYSALWAFVRLRELGMPMELLTMPGFVTAIAYQRLVPALCHQCSIPLSRQTSALEPALMQRLQHCLVGNLDNVRLRGPGCPHCNGTGLSGRTVCAETVMPDRNLLALVADNHFAEVERYWLGQLQDQKELTVMAHAIAKVGAGELDPRDAESSLGKLRHDQVVGV